MFSALAESLHSLLLECSSDDPDTVYIDVVSFLQYAFTRNESLVVKGNGEGDAGGERKFIRVFAIGLHRIRT
jgi:hypothetical protein